MPKKYMVKKEATTSESKKVGKSPAEGQKEAIISEEKGNQQSPEKTQGEIELEEKVEKLEIELEQSRTLQGQADKKRRTEKIARIKLEKKLKRIQNGEVVEAEEPTDSGALELSLRARVAIQNLLLDNPDYQELIKNDFTLKEILKNNPFALIGDYYDVEDAVDQIKEKLDKSVSIYKQKSQPTQEEESGEEFNAGVIQPEEGAPEDDTSKEDDKNISPVEKVEKSIKSKIQIT